MTDTSGFTTKQLLTLIAQTNERIDRNYEEQRKTNRELVEINRTLAEGQIAIAGILNRMDDRIPRLEAR